MIWIHSKLIFYCSSTRFFNGARVWIGFCICIRLNYYYFHSCHSSAVVITLPKFEKITREINLAHDKHVLKRCARISKRFHAHDARRRYGYKRGGTAVRVMSDEMRAYMYRLPQTRWYILPTPWLPSGDQVLNRKIGGVGVRVRFWTSADAI